MINSSQTENSAIIVPKITCYFEKTRLDHWLGSDINWKTSQPIGYQCYPLETNELNKKSFVGVSSTCCLLVPIAVINTIGKMDEKYFMYYDDADFTLRASRAGFKMLYEPASNIFHKCNKTTSTKQPSYFEYYLANRNVFYFYNKLCPSKIQKYAFFCILTIRFIKKYLKTFITKDVHRRNIILITISDILNKKMGAPPKELYSGVKK